MSREKRKYTMYILVYINTYIMYIIKFTWDNIEFNFIQNIFVDSSL